VLNSAGFSRCGSFRQPSLPGREDKNFDGQWRQPIGTDPAFRHFPTSFSTTAVQTIIDILQDRAKRQHDKVAYTFLSDGEEETGSLTFGELDRQARKIAARLLQTARPGDRAVLLYPTGLEFVASFFGCLYAGIIAVPVYPPRARGHVEHQLSLINDCRPAVILCEEEVGRQVQPRSAGFDSRKIPDIIDASELHGLAGSLQDSGQKPEVSPKTIAFLQYTSGSTASPRGVMVSHANLISNQRVIAGGFGVAENSVFVCWLPLYHDMGLIGGIVATIHFGGHCILIPPAAFIQRPARWLEAVTRYRGTVTGGPNFAYELCVRKITGTQKEKLDLSSLCLVANGAEPVRSSTMEQFLEAFGPCGLRREAFRPCYGLAESTLAVSLASGNEPIGGTRFDASALEHNVVIEAGDQTSVSRSFVSCGRGPADQKIVTVDPETHIPCPPGRVGEIWVSSPSIAEGYWNKPELTEITFRARLSRTGEGPFLRTGDLGFLHQGELYITGRHKDLIIINGRNYFPQDIELHLEQSFPALEPGGGAAFSVELDGEEQLVIVYEVKRSYIRGLDPELLAESMRQTIAAHHELGVHAIEFVKPMTIPKTSSGKIQRGQCRKKFLDGTLDRLDRKRTHALILSYEENPQPIQFSLFYFSSNDAQFEEDKYRLFLEGAKFADEHDFAAVWVPERHFHPFGGIYPNPSVLASALAVTTRRIRIRAGSVVLPLHNPIRVAEEWSAVDNLSGGRVDVAFARGWNPNDFALAPGNYSNSLEVLYRSMETVRRLWRGDSIAVPNGKGEEIQISIHPRPRQRELPVWLTCSGGVERFMEAGAGGWNVLTGLLFQSVEDLSGKISAYREARARSGHDPRTGRVTVMMHTFLGADPEEVKKTVRGPFIEYLKSSVDLWRHGSKDLSDLNEDGRREILDFAFERYYQTNGLFGTPESCLGLVDRLRRAGADEIACLIDFGVELRTVLNGLHALHWLQEQARTMSTSSGQAGRPGFSPRENRIWTAQTIDWDETAPENQALLRWIREVMTMEISAFIQVSPDARLPGKHFLNLGMNSLNAVEFLKALEEQFGLKLSPSLLFDFPTIDRLSVAVARAHRNQLISRMPVSEKSVAAKA
jgi:natural product biosynthesis luciferase-like monooxygenase protein